MKEVERKKIAKKTRRGSEGRIGLDKRDKTE